MRIAICSPDRELRYHLSRLTEEALLRRGILPEVVMLPLFGELADKSAQHSNPFAFAVVSDARDASSLREICRKLPVILVGAKDDGVSAYDIGAKYFLESPIETVNIDKAITHCLLNG